MFRVWDLELRCLIFSCCCPECIMTPCKLKNCLTMLEIKTRTFGVLVFKLWISSDICMSSGLPTELRGQVGLSV